MRRNDGIIEWISIHSRPSINSLPRPQILRQRLWEGTYPGNGSRIACELKGKEGGMVWEKGVMERKRKGKNPSSLLCSQPSRKNKMPFPVMRRRSQEKPGLFNSVTCTSLPSFYSLSFTGVVYLYFCAFNWSWSQEVEKKQSKLLASRKSCSTKARW